MHKKSEMAGVTAAVLAAACVFIGFVPETRADECTLRRSEEGSIGALIESTQKLAAQGAGSCRSGITRQDRAQLAAMHGEFVALEKKKKFRTPQQRAKAFGKVIATHETELSPAAVAALLASSAQLRLNAISEDLKTDRKLGASLKSFDQEIKRYNERRNRMFGGTRGISEKGFLGGNEDNERLDRVVEQLKSAIKVSSLDAESKRILSKNMYAVLSQSYQNASRRALEGADWASVGQYAASSVLAVDLIALSVITAFTPAGAVTSTGARIALGTLSGASGGAGLMAADGLARAGGHAAVRSTQEGDFFCRLSEEMNQKGREVLHNALMGALVGGGFGGGLSAAAAVNATIAKVAGAGVSAVFAAKAGKDAVKSGTRARVLHEEAKKAKGLGKAEKAAQLDQDAREATVDAAVDTVAAGAMIAGGVKIARGLILKKPVVSEFRPGTGEKIDLPVKEVEPPQGQSCPLPQKNRARGKVPAQTEADVPVAGPEEPGNGAVAGKEAQPAREVAGGGQEKVRKVTDKEWEKFQNRKGPLTAKDYGLISFAALATATVQGCGNKGEGTSVTMNSPSDCVKTNSCVITLSWDAPVEADGKPSQVSGYKIYWGNASRSYTKNVDVGNSLQAEIRDLGVGNYYFAATAYIPGMESGYSNEVYLGITVAGQKVIDNGPQPTPVPTATPGPAGGGVAQNPN